MIVKAPLGPFTGRGKIAWSASTLASYREAGKPIFVDVTADWCITCLANEAAVLFTPEIEGAFLAADIPYMIADWTDYDADIGEFVNLMVAVASRCTSCTPAA